MPFVKDETREMNSFSQKKYEQVETREQLIYFKHCSLYPSLDGVRILMGRTVEVYSVLKHTACVDNLEKGKTGRRDCMISNILVIRMRKQSNFVNSCVYICKNTTC